MTQPTLSPTNSETAHILVVDDSAEVRRSLAANLSELPLHVRVDEAENGAVALKMCVSTRYDCVICDIEMPLMSGIEFLRTIRSQKSALELPVLLLTTENKVRSKLDGFKAGASDFVTKPWVPEELMARMMSQVNIAALNRRITKLANEDPLTSLANRRMFMRGLKAECSRANRCNHQIALIMVDIDRFKRINDTHGHPIGDTVIVALARILAQTHRLYDAVGRLGGEEFALLIPEVSAEHAVGIGERLRSLVEASRLGNLPVGAVTISIGIALGSPGTLRAEDLYKCADDQLYRAKHKGRNRVCFGQASCATRTGELFGEKLE